jgi:hypothetical protein
MAVAYRCDGLGYGHATFLVTPPSRKTCNAHIASNLDCPMLVQAEPRSSRHTYSRDLLVSPAHV